jgi:hypothetical protein
MYEKHINSNFGAIIPLKAFLVKLSFPTNRFFLGEKKSKCLLKRILFYMMFFIPMVAWNNSRSNWLNKNGHDYLLSHRTEAELDIIKNVFEKMKHSKNA